MSRETCVLSVISGVGRAGLGEALAGRLAVSIILGTLDLGEVRTLMGDGAG